jgi:hypothetical protein
MHATCTFATVALPCCAAVSASYPNYAGKEYPLEMHIVNFVHDDVLPGCGASGCATVVGVLFELYEDDAAVKNKFIDAVFSAMSSFENVSGKQQTQGSVDFQPWWRGPNVRHE